jgi:hypothetical protein
MFGRMRTRHGHSVPTSGSVANHLLEQGEVGGAARYLRFPGSSTEASQRATAERR